MQKDFKREQLFLTLTPLKVAFILFWALCSTPSSATEEQQRKRVIVVPIELNAANLPVTRIAIQDLPSEIMLDTGSPYGMHIPNDLVSRLAGVRIDRDGERTTDVTGKVVTSDALQFPSLVLNGMEFNNVEGTTLVDWGLSIGGNENMRGIVTLGLGLFKGKVLLVDYRKKALTIAEDISQIPRPKDNWISLPFRQSTDGLVVTVRVGTSNYDLILDTGASLSMLMSSKMKSKAGLTSCERSLPDIDFDGCYTVNYSIASSQLQGPRINALVYTDKNTSDFEFDGLIGNDFFSMFSVLIDFKNSQLLVRPNS